MAILGAQLVITLIMISIIQKLGPHFSFAKWILCSTGLVRYLYPTDSELRQLANIRKISQNLKGLPNMVSFRTRSQFEYDMVFSSDIICPVSFSVLLTANKILLSLTVQYFQGEESVGERSTCIVMGFIYLLISMMVLIVDENTLETGLESAYKSFNQSASSFLDKQGLLSTYFRDRKLMQVLLNFTFALPFILIVLWIKPVSRHYLTVKIFSGRTEPLLSEYVFESIRFIAIVVTMLLKLILMPWYLQAYLDMAYHRAENQKKKLIAAVFYYLCVVTLQYIAPVIMCLYLSLMYKTLGEYSWTGFMKEPPNPEECPINSENISSDIDPFKSSDDTATVYKSAAEFHVTLESLKTIFTTNVYRGLFGFSTWWCCFTYFAATSIGLIYQSYFSSV
ncbi:hypothetical protein NQ317_001607 [Molorchus minor]|uniref:Gustatory receptor n=1 Tax=Molorchus minor TaxID=1323400 RepID=A0ABQ9J617_9CUCU|nr:hypothetical protein NQ317_001607 [Molorchus minor]